jgi:hypothetical protein
VRGVDELDTATSGNWALTSRPVSILGPVCYIARDAKDRATGRRRETQQTDHYRRNTMAFEDISVHVRLKLFALWSSVMFFYIYGDYFQLYETGQLQQMIAGRMPFAAISQRVLLGMAGVMVVPSLMPFLSLVLPVRLNRWLNIIFGVIYSLIMVVAFKSSWYFYILFGVIEIILTLLIVWYAWTWPKEASNR